MAEPPSLLHRSIVTVLSADVVGSTEHILGREPEYAHAFNDRCFEHVRAAVEAAGGRVLDRAGDGCLAVFGWPVALEEHADQACRAAWEIQHTPLRCDDAQDTPIRLRVGVHSGRVAVQAATSRVSGATVNIAAKLQQGAHPGTAVVSDDTVRHCKLAFELAPLGVAQDGRGPLVPAYRLENRPERIGRDGLVRRYRYQVVGRTAELGELIAQLPEAGARGGSIALVGEAGVGKSRLAAEAAAQAEAAGARVLTFYGDALKREVAFAAARALLADLCRATDSATLGELREVLAALGAPDDDIGVIATLFGGRPPRGAPVTPTQLARAMTSLFAAQARLRPMLLLVEDLHLVDPESQLLLRLLGRERAHEALSLLVTARPEARQRAAAVVDHVRLVEPMPVADMQALARLVWPTNDPSPALIARAVERADGLPFVLEQLARSAEAANAEAFALPENVESIIHMRLQSLPMADAARTASQVLSLLGGIVEVGLLQTVMDLDGESGLDGDMLGLALSVLERFAFLESAGDGTVRFRHHILAEACAGTITLARRAGLHRAAFAALRDLPSALAGRNLQIALHADGAGLDREALDYLLRAAREARGTSAAASLNLIFDRALAVISRLRQGDDDARREADEKYGSIVGMAFPSMLILGEFNKMSAHLPPVIELARRRGQLSKVSSIQSQLGMLCWFEGRYEEGRQATAAGLAIARDLEEPALIYANQVMLANVLHGTGQIDAALEELASLRAVLADVPEAERWGSPANPRSSALGFTCWIMLETGRFQEAMAYAERALDVAVRLDDPYSQVMARNAIGRCLLLMGRNQEAADCLTIASDLVEANGYDAIKANLAGHLATALTRIGRAPEAARIAEACLAEELHLRTGQMENFTLKVGYGEALVRLGDTDAGFELIDEALAIARRIGNPCLTASGLALRGQLLEDLGRSDPNARSDLEAARRAIAVTA